MAHSWEVPFPWDININNARSAQCRPEPEPPVKAGHCCRIRSMPNIFLVFRVVCAGPLMVLCAYVQQWELPKDLTAVHAFMEAIQKRESWKNTYYTEKYVADGWHKKLETMGVKK